MLENTIEIIQIGLHPELLGKRNDTLGADLGRAEHRAQVPVQELRRAGVDEQQFPNVIAHRAFVDQLHYGEANAFVPDLRRLGVVRAREPAADIRLVRPVAAEARQHRVPLGPLHPDRPTDHPVGEMISSRNIRVGENEHIARLHSIPKPAQQRPDPETPTAGVDRNPVGIGNQRAVGRGDETAEVVRLAEDGAARGAGHDPPHVPADLIESVLHERQHDGVQAGRTGVPYLGDVATVA